MALSKVQNFASILSNNALAGGKIENGFSMFEAPPSNCSTDNRHGEYDPWSYDLLGRNSNKKAILEDEEAQDLNNSMVNDLVAKILDDDPITTEDTYANRYNVNPRCYNDTQNSRMLKGRNSVTTINNHHDDIGISQIYYPYNKLSPQIVNNQDENNHEFVNMCSALNTMTLNDCIAQTLEKTDDYGIITSTNCQRTILPEQRLNQRVTNDIANVTMRNYGSTSSNGLLTTTNGQNYANVQSSNWSENGTNQDYAKDVFGNYQNMQNSPNHDMNFNTISLAEMDLRGNIGNSLTPNNHHNHHSHHYNNQTLNLSDSYNPTTANNQSYRPSSSLNEMIGDSVFTTSTKLQNFTPSESTLQNCLGTNYTRNNYDDYKEIHDGVSVNMSNMLQNDPLYLQQQQQQQQQQQNSYKHDRQMDQNYKALMNRFLSPNDFNLSPNGDICQNDCNPMTFNHNHRIDANPIKVTSPRTKNREAHGQNTKLRGYPKNLTQQLQCQNDEPTNKYNYQVHNGYQRYTASNSDSIKAIPQNSAYPAASLKRSNGNTQSSYNIDRYDLTTDIPFNGSAHLAQQIARASIENNVFNHIMKQRHHQIQRMSGVPGGGGAGGVLLNARLMRTGNQQGTTVFPSIMPVVQVPVSTINPMSVLFGGVNLRNGPKSVRRAGPSSVLHLRLEQTFEQFKHLEKERKKCEAALADHFPGKRVSSANNIPTPRLQGNSSRADRLIVDHFQEHARVITLIAKMEHLRGATMSERIHKAMEYWLEAIKYVQECRKKEIEYANMRRKESPECIPINDDKHVLALAGSIHQLTKASKVARTGMYNALQSTLLHDKHFETTIVEKSEDPIVPAVKTVEQSTNGEIGQFTNTT